MADGAAQRPRSSPLRSDTSRSTTRVAGVSLGSLALATLALGGAQVLVSAYGNPMLGSLTTVILSVVILRFRTITI